MNIHTRQTFTLRKQRKRDKHNVREYAKPNKKKRRDPVGISKKRKNKLLGLKFCFDLV